MRRWASCPRLAAWRLARARPCHIAPTCGRRWSFFISGACSEHAQKSTRITSQQRWRNRCVFPRYLHQQVQDRKPPVNEHKRVLFTVITLPQAALPLGSSACNHASESLDTGSAGLIASGANNGRSHSGRVSRLVPFVVALRQHGRATGCQPVSERVPTALPGRRRTFLMAAYSMNGPSDHFPGKPGFRWKPSVHSLCRPQESHPVWSFPQKHRSRSRRTSTATRVTPRVTRDTLPDISSTQPRAQSHADTRRLRRDPGG